MLHAVYTVLLARSSGQNDVVVGTAVPAIGRGPTTANPVASRHVHQAKAAIDRGRDLSRR